MMDGCKIYFFRLCLLNTSYGFPVDNSYFSMLKRFPTSYGLNAALGMKAWLLATPVRLKTVHSRREREPLTMCTYNDGPVYIWWRLAGEKRAHYRLHVDSEFSVSPSCSATSCPVIFDVLKLTLKSCQGSLVSLFFIVTTQVGCSCCNVLWSCANNLL